MAETSRSQVYSSTPQCGNADDTPIALNLTEDSGYSSNFSGCTSSTSLSSIFNHTKSLDESQKQLNSIHENTSIVLSDRSCLAGQKYVDFLSRLGDRYQDMILKKIFLHLNDEDLHSCSLVSKAWRYIIVSIPSEKKRLRDYAKKIERNKENRHTHTPKKSHTQEDQRCFTTLTPRHKLVQIQNIQESASSSSASPPAFKHNYRFEAYQKEGRKLKAGQKLYPCPKCKLPSHVDPKMPNIAICTNSTCIYRFCTRCQCVEHPYKLCNFITTPVVPKRSDNFGTAKSKRNLKRLLNIDGGF